MELKGSTEGFQANLEVVFLMSDCNAVTEQHLSVWRPESVVNRDVGIVRGVQGLIHEQLSGRQRDFHLKK